MLVRWRNRGAGDALRTVSDAMHDGSHYAGEALLRGSTAGLEVARSLGGDMADGMRRLRGSGREAVAGHPLGAVLVAAAVGFAAGWVVRRARELRAARSERTRSRGEGPRPRAARAAPRKQSANGSRRPSARQIM